MTGIEVDSLKWQVVAKYFAHYHAPDDSEELQHDTCPNSVINNACANTGKEEEMLPFIISEISDTQHADEPLLLFFKHEQKGEFQNYQISIFGDVKVITNKKMKLVIPGSLRTK